MSRHNYLFTSESVTEGHPDKIADQISDGILDAIIAQDKRSRVACETILTTGIAFVAGEISTKAYVEIPDIIRETIRQIGYTDAAWGFDYHTCSVIKAPGGVGIRSEEHTSELQSPCNLVCRLLLEKKKKQAHMY